MGGWRGGLKTSANQIEGCGCFGALGIAARGCRICGSSNVCDMAWRGPPTGAVLQCQCGNAPSDTSTGITGAWSGVRLGARADDADYTAVPDSSRGGGGVMKDRFGYTQSLSRPNLI